MKINNLVLFTILALFSFSALSHANTLNGGTSMFRINVVTKNNYLPDKYTQNANTEDKYKDNPIVSFPIEIQNIPKGTKSLALTFIDFDAVSVCGFPWIHWIACNIPPYTKLIPENISKNNELGIIQGSNSYSSFFVGETDTNITIGYVGPTPPDKDHNYDLVVYALDKDLKLDKGYFLNDFYKEIKGHILGEAKLEILSRF